MARRARTHADIRRRYNIQQDMQLIDAVCSRFCKGDSPTQIREFIERGLGRVLTREQPYQILSYAALNGLLKYAPPPDYELARKLKEADHRLVEVEVVRTDQLELVATRAAEVLLRMLQQLAVRKGAKEVHIGLAGGGTILRTVKAFGELLNGPVKDLPPKLVFHAMVTGLQLHDPRTDPNTFFNYLPFGKSGKLTTEFVALHGPALPDGDLIEHLLETHQPTIKAFDEGKQIDLVVTSGTSWKNDEDRRHSHSHLKRLLTGYKDDDGRDVVSVLEKEHGCVGDLLWQPVNEEGPIPDETKVRAMTLRRLDELPGAIDKGAQVLLVLGPCACGRARDDVLRTVLGWKKRYITHLVADNRTASV